MLLRPSGSPDVSWQAGDHIVISSRLYGGTFNQFSYTFPRIGIEVTFVDPADPKNFEKAIRPNTKILYGETLGNPDIAVFPFEEVSGVAQKYHIPLMIDNTFATPYLFRPFEWGAHIITHSTTKFLGGHGTSIGGAIVDGGNFDWTSGRFPNFTTPDPSYHGLVYADLLGVGLPPFIIKARVQVLRDYGACQSPFNSWQTIQGIETLSLRMDRHVQNAQAVAEFLEKHPRVSWVKLPRLEKSSGLPACQKVLSQGSRGYPGFWNKRRRGRRQEVYRILASSSAIWRMWVMPRAWLSIPPPPHIASSLTMNRSARGLLPILSA